MARIAGVDLPAKKRAEIGLTYIYGIGRSRSLSLLHRAGVDAGKRVADLTEDEVNKIRTIIENEGAVAGNEALPMAQRSPRLCTSIASTPLFSSAVTSVISPS